MTSITKTDVALLTLCYQYELAQTESIKKKVKEIKNAKKEFHKVFRKYCAWHQNIPLTYLPQEVHCTVNRWSRSIQKGPPSRDASFSKVKDKAKTYGRLKKEMGKELQDQTSDLFFAVESGKAFKAEVIKRFNDGKDPDKIRQSLETDCDKLKDETIEVLNSWYQEYLHQDIKC